MDLPLVYHPSYSAPLPSTHRFPMAKFRLLYDRLLHDRVVSPQQFQQPDRPPLEWLALVHSLDYIQSYSEGQLDERSLRRIGLPWSPALVERTWIAVGGTILTARLALQHGLACNLAGGTHHAFPDYGSGFCIFNDCAIAAKLLLQEELVERILIVDLDVHQGDGTAWIFRDEPRVFTFSMHCEANFPARKQQSDCDVALAEGMEDDAYLQKLAHYLPDLLSQFRPDLVIYNAGVDPHAGDRLGKLALTDTGLFRREMQVLETCVRQGYPVASVLGGGYCEDFDALVYRHSLCQRAASDVYRTAA
ncbi:histone deacetylase family protein [Synechococcus elongatus]|uniref:Histone deacetylase n=1 Tax=Synechococcus elongatus PCC 11801 TaxID=2219813 RepID=A0AAN1QNE6_SYNEL|nr:histone deacetylase [Synechococcus elongatus]AZB72522.1 histone deacetylase [Synechococcus elongatus PCC 11801]